MHKIILLITAMLVGTSPLRAQQAYGVTPAQTYGAAETKKTKYFAPVFWSATLKQPPLPFNPFPELKLYDAGTNNFVYDDREVDYPALRAAMAEEQAELKAAAAKIRAAAGEAENDGGGGMAMRSMSGGLRLGFPLSDGTNLNFSIEGAEPNGRYDVYSSTNLTNWNYLFRTATGQTNLTILPPSGSRCFFQLGTLQDTDEDTLPDAFEHLITQTDPSAANTLANAAGNTNLTAWLTDHPPHLYLKTVLKVYGYQPLYEPCAIEGAQVDKVIEKLVWDSATGGNETKYLKRQVCLQSNIVGFIQESVTFWEPDDTGCFMGRFDGGPWSVGCTNQDGTVPASPRHGPHGTVWEHERTGELAPGSGDPAYEKTEIKERVWLDTRGLALSTKSRLYRLSAAVTAWNPDNLTQSNVPPGEISVLGQTLDADYHTFVLLPDNTSHDLTPQLLSACTTFTYIVSAERIDVTLTRGGLNVTDGFSTVWVGEQISLICQTEPAGYVLSNILWTVPGHTISNWAADASRTYYEPSYPKTNAGVAYYWLDGHQRVEVTVQVVVAGFTLPARTTFEVRRPNTTITAQIQNVVTVDNNWLVAPALHFGYAPPGIKFSYVTDVGAGFSYQWVQTGTVLRRIRNASDGLWYRAGTNGLDTHYPYLKTMINGIEQEWASDSPGSGPLNGDLEYTADDSFTMHLMFKPQVNAANTIWVPLRQINWSWNGHAVLSNGNYSLADGSAPPPGADADSTSHPLWERNIKDYLLPASYTVE